jgi:hypothetical protein
MQAKASRTLRKYGRCEEDVWNSVEAAVAEQLLSCLRKVSSMRRSGLRLNAADRDARWWSGEVVPCEQLMADAVEDFVRSGGYSRVLCVDVGVRLMDSLHLPAVQEALGSLILPELEVRFDGKKPKRGPRHESEAVGVCVDVGG